MSLEITSPLASEFHAGCSIVSRETVAPPKDNPPCLEVEAEPSSGSFSLSLAPADGAEQPCSERSRERAEAGTGVTRI